MSVWKAKMETAFFHGEESYEQECTVRLERENIAVSYEDNENNLVVYTGTDHGGGHFVLGYPELKAKATLHQMEGSKCLEGYWVEEGVRGFWRIVLIENKEDDYKEHGEELRELEPGSLSFVLPNGRPICSIEIDVDNLANEDQYQHGGWEDLIFSIAAKWTKENSFMGRGTVWAWGAYSANFHHQNFSMFYTVLGMPQGFREYLGQEISVLGKHVRSNSDYVIPDAENGWDARCHIEHGKVWQILDPVTCREIKA